MQVMDSVLHRVRVVAARLDVSVATVYRAIGSGRLRALRIGAGRRGAVRVPESAVTEYLRTCEEAATGERVTR